MTRFFSALDIGTLTLFHLIRIPVELVLFWLSLQQLVPKAMTLEGVNFDILIGMSAPFIYYFGFVRKTMSPKLIIAWNWIGIALLSVPVSIVAYSAIMAAASPDLSHPPMAILRFPGTLLPGFIVP